MLRTMKEEWTDFVRKSYEGVPIGNTQYDEVRKAFYAGALVMLLNVNRIGEFYPCKPDIFEKTYEPVENKKGE